MNHSNRGGKIYDSTCLNEHCLHGILPLDSVCLASAELASEILEMKVLYKQPGRCIGWHSVTITENGDLLAAFSGDRNVHVSPDGRTQMVDSHGQHRIKRRCMAIYEY